MATDNFSKWQERTQSLRTHTINVFFGVTVASIGFILSQILDAEFTFRNENASIFIFISLVGLVLASIVLLTILLFRLRDFRITTQIARKKDKNDQSELEILREEAIRLGKKTNFGFLIAVGLFGIGEIGAIRFWNRTFCVFILAINSLYFGN